jgi:hypothetical protein
MAGRGDRIDGLISDHHMDNLRTAKDTRLLRSLEYGRSGCEGIIAKGACEGAHCSGLLEGARHPSHT